VLRPKRDRVGYELLREREVITGCFAHGHSILDAHAFYVLRVWLSWVRCFVCLEADLAAEYPLIIAFIESMATLNGCM
jgi:hypothetical protein